MITWMQRHRKYLVITIWISTIAFVGAGFVGWGAYDFNKDRSASVAKVGHRTVSVQEFQSAYANHYNFYNKLLQGKLTQEQADQMGLDKIVMKTLVDQALMLNYADELGLLASKDDVKERLISNPNFQTNGTFNKDLYYSILKSNRINPSDYEKGLEKEILYNKVESVFKLPASQEEINIFTAALFMQDRLSVSVISLDPNEVSASDDQIKTYWEAHKSEYLTKKSYTLELLPIPSTNIKTDTKGIEAFFEQEKYNYKHDDGKLMSFDGAKDQVIKDYQLKNDKKIALESYLALKKGEVNATETKVIYDDDTTFPLEKIQTAAKDEVLKPIILKDHYVIIKVKDIKFPEPMSFELAKKDATRGLLDELKSTALIKKAEAKVASFSGQDIGFVSRDSVQSIAGLGEAKSAEFLSYVFDNTTKKGYKIIDGKAIVYEILEQKLLNQDKAKQYVSLISENVEKAKQAELNQNLIKKLATLYKVEQYYKGK